LRKDFINGISEALGITRKEMIEKDFILHHPIVAQ
jgi:hypothetical protein